MAKRGTLKEEQQSDLLVPSVGYPRASFYAMNEPPSTGSNFYTHKENIQTKKESI